jgi:TonB family protein
VPSATRIKESSAPASVERRSASATKKPKLAVLLITPDDQLWPQIGAHLNNTLVLKQLDSVDEFIAATPAGQPAVVLWDARHQADTAAVLSRLQLHSPRLAVIALDEVGSAHAWAKPMELRQVVAHVALPLQADKLISALGNAQEEVHARVALLGNEAAAEPHAASGGTVSGAHGIPWIPAVIIVGVLLVCAGAYVYLGRGHAPPPSPVPTHAAAASLPAAAPPAADDRVDALIDKARQAMLDRHFIDPADGSALSLYRSTLLLDPGNGEARQGLKRLAEILIARVQSALDDRKFDLALQSFETARSIDPGDSRLPALDERITSLRAEFGPAQILAAINAQNFDRASQLIDEAARAKSLNSAKLAQLRDDLRHRHEQVDTENFVKLIDTRLQQDKVTEPRNDSAAYYLGQARAAGAGAASLQPQAQEIYKRLAQTVHTAIEQHRFGDVDRLLADLRTDGIPSATIASLQRDLVNARGQQEAAAPEEPPYLDLAQSRLAQGKLTEPDNDSALYYVNQLRAADPKNSALPRIAGALQGQIVDQARAALDTQQPGRAEALLTAATGLGPSADLEAQRLRLAQLKQAAAGVPEVTEASLTRSKSINLEYPDAARRANIEGWVDLSFHVTADGKVSTVKVLNANPAGAFEAAATRAVSRARYAPMMQNGKAIEVSTKLRIAFRLAK